MDSHHWTGDDDRETLDARRDVPIKMRIVSCAGCDHWVRVLYVRAGVVRIYCDECRTHGAPIRRT